MTVLPRRPTLRWLLPAIVALALAAGGSAVGAIRAAAGSDLPHRSAARLLVDVQKARVDGLSGTIVQNADLGLPALPDTGGSGSSSLSSLVSGSHTLRLWYVGPNRFRLALLGSLGESDVVRNGTNLWTWSSKDKSASHHVVPLHKDAPQSLASASPMTPQRAAETALHAIDSSTKVTSGSTTQVAGRSAYQLVLRPRDHGSLVRTIRIAIDSSTHVPTRVQVFARGHSKPAFEVAFTSFDPTPPAASVFRFNPPAGTKVTQGSQDSQGSQGSQSALPGHLGPASGAHGSAPAASERPQVVGSGWTTVLITHLPKGALKGSGTMGEVLGAMPKASGSWGSGRVLRGTLFSAVLTDDGRVAVGAVSPQRLLAALSKR